MGLNRERKAERRGVADMTRRIYSILAAALFVFVSCAGCAKAENPQKATSNETSKKTAAAQSPGPVFTCTSAGRWFTGNPAELRDMVDRMLADASPIEIKGRIDIADPVQQHRSLVTVGAIAGEHIGGRQIAHAGHDQLFPLSIDQIGADETPSLTVLHIALSVIHAETMQGIMQIRMFGVKQ